LVKAVATILHTKQTLGYLNFDISPTNEAFKKNLERLLKVSDRWCVVQTPLLAEYLGENVLNSVTHDVSPKRDQTSIKRPHPSSTYRKRTTRVLGFRPRGKPESVTVKEAYLEKLKDECQRKRVHVPIPGRSFARQDETDDAAHSDGSGFMGSSTIHRRDSLLTTNRKTAIPQTWNRSSDSSVRKPPASSTPHPSSWSRTGADLPERTSDSRPIPLAERLAARTSAAANCRKASGIKLLDFDQLPAFGPKAKQLRKEQMEKEREMKKLEKEERLKEQRAAREAAKLARQSERQAQMEARRHNTSTTWNAVPPPTTADVLMPHAGENDTGLNHEKAVADMNIDKNHHCLSDTAAIGDHRLPTGASQAVSQKPFGLTPASNAGNFMVRHPLLGFNPSARMSIHGNDMTSSVSSSIQSGFSSSYSSTTTTSSSFAPPNSYTLQSNSQLVDMPDETHVAHSNASTHLLSEPPRQSQPQVQSQPPQSQTQLVHRAQSQQHQATPILITSSTNPTTPHRVIAPRLAGVPTIKVVSGPHPNPLIRIETAMAAAAATTKTTTIAPPRALSGMLITCRIKTASLP
uniref:Negative elongation factor A n=1 Tax=Echinostoma caproni TaxID=27848 RepID=A0A183BDK8_9TREM